MSSAPVWFVTGASQGLGLSIVKAIISKGWKVAAATRSVDRLVSSVGINNDNFFPVSMDITKDDDVKRSVEAII